MSEEIVRIVELTQMLRDRYPEHSKTISAILDVAHVVDALPFDTFFEPVSVVQMKKDRRQLMTINAPNVAAWANHVAYASRARMRALEIPILREINDGHLTSSATLLRAHLETAGLASHALLTVMDAGMTGDKQRLDELMRGTLFGTALFKETKRVPELRDYLMFSQQGTGKACEYLESLDRFLEPGKPPGDRQRLRYALLCEWCHPNLGGFKGFARVAQEAETGWLMRYGWQEELGVWGVQMVMEYLLENMRFGYAASEILRLTTFNDDGSGLQCYAPDRSDMTRIASSIMGLA